MTILGLRLPVFCFFFLGFPLLWLLWIGVYTISPGPPSPDSKIEVIIPSRSSISEIEHILVDKKIIRDDRRFSMLAILTGAAKKLQAGEYRFKTGKKPLAIIDLLKEGKVFYRSVTMPEGTDMSKVADILAAEKWIDRSQFLNLAYDSGFLKEMGLEARVLRATCFLTRTIFPGGSKMKRGLSG